MEIGIIGAGNIGSTLAGYFTAMGHEVCIANSRGPNTLQDLSAKTGAKAVTVEHAAGAKDLVILAIPQKAITNLPQAIFTSSNAIIVDAGNYYPSRDGHIDAILEGMTDSEWVAQTIGCPVIKAFNNIVASSLATKGAPAGSKHRITLSVAGDRVKDKMVVMQLIDSIGFDTLDAGLLADSWRQQPGEPAYCQDLSKEMLAQAWQQADSKKRAANRNAADEIAKPYF